jgi:hypothetical protein
MHLFLLLCLFFGFSEDTYYVTFSNQSVLYAKNYQPLQTGDKISGEEELVFKNQAAFAGVVGAKGRFRISGTKSKFHHTAEYKSKLKDALTVGLVVKNISEEELNTRSALQRHFMTDSSGLYLCTQPEKIALPDVAYRLSSKHYFFMKYSYRSKTISVKLPAIIHPEQNDTLIIDPDIYLYEGKPIKQEEIRDMRLYFQDDVKRQTTPIGRVKPVFVKEENLLPELRVLYREYKKLYGTDQAKIKSELGAHLSEFYGKPNEALLERLFQKINQ